MTRKEYIEKLEAVRQQLLAIAAEFNNARITDEQENEKTRRVTAGKLFDKLDDILYDNGAVSLRIMGENHERGIGEQVGLFDHANKAEVVGETTDAPTFEKSPTAVKVIGLCKYCAWSGDAGCEVCTLEKKYGKKCDGLDVHCGDHAEKKTRGKKGAK